MDTLRTLLLTDCHQAGPGPGRAPRSVQALGEPKGACRLYGTVTPCRTTGPGTGLSSVPCATPGGVIVSITSGTAVGLSEQIGSVPPTGHIPSVNAPGFVVKEMAWSALKPFCPVIATVNVQADVGVPNSASGRAM